jgi:hypothetical protein
LQQLSGLHHYSPGPNYPLLNQPRRHGRTTCARATLRGAGSASRFRATPSSEAAHGTKSERDESTANALMPVSSDGGTGWPRRPTKNPEPGPPRRPSPQAIGDPCSGPRPSRAPAAMNAGRRIRTTPSALPPGDLAKGHRTTTARGHTAASTRRRRPSGPIRSPDCPAGDGSGGATSWLCVKRRS